MLSKKYAVSVIVPVYNVEKYIKECLDSLVNQTLKNIEIIVVNDGSPDNSQVIIDEYVKKYPDKVKSFIKKNGGLSDARNYGINKASGEYIAFVDSDDYVDKDMLKKMYNKAITTTSDIVVCKFIKFTNKQSFISDEVFPKYGKFNVISDPSLLTVAKSYACNKMFKKTLFTKNKIKFPVGQNFEDSAIVYNLMLKADGIVFLDEGLYYYRRSRQQSITNEFNSKVFDIFKSCDSIINFYKENSVYEELYPYVRDVCLLHLMRRLVVANASNDIKLKNNFIDALYEYLNRNFPKWYHCKYVKQLFKKRSKLFMMCLKNKNTFKIYYNYLQKIKKSKKLQKIKKLKVVKKLSRWFKKLIKLPKRVIRKILRTFNIKKSSPKPREYLVPNYIEEVKKVQKYSVDILKVVDKLCKKYNLTYYLSEGTLLGAVRHNGFIPWDDDVDIMMPREDYEKFIDIAIEELKGDYVLQSSRNIENYWVASIKVRMTKKTEYVQKELTGLTENNGPYIDIFPLDYFPRENSFLQKHYMKKVSDFKLILWYKSSNKRFLDLKGFKRKILILRSKFYSIPEIHRQLYSAMTHFNNKPHNYIINYGSYYDYNKQIFPFDYYGKPRMVQFENLKLPIPQQSEKILTKIYGNYMQLPSINSRYPKHTFFKTPINYDKRKKILLVVDKDNWAFYNIATNVMRNLADEYDIKIVSMLSENISIKTLFKTYNDYDCLHFFWRKLLFPLKDVDDKFINKYVSNKLITTSVYDHLYLEEEHAKMDIVLKFAKEYTVSSNKLYQIYSHISGIKKPKMVITDGVDLDKFYPKNMERFDNFDRPLVVGWVGNSKWVSSQPDLKGVNTILKPAIAELKEEGYNIEEYFAVRVNGFIPHDEMVDYYAKIDVCVCASETEGTPNPVLEAMACGVAIVSTDVGIVPDVLASKQKKYILKKRSKDCLKKELIKLINNRALVKELSEENLVSIKNWDWKIKCSEFRDFFKEVMENKDDK